MSGAAGPSAPDAGAAPAGASTITVTFFTHHPFPLVKVPPTTFAVPSNTLPEGLNALVNDLLELKPQVPFDFLINSEYVSTSLATFVRRRALSTEDVIHVEYLPSLQAQEGSRLPHDDWVSSLRAPVCGNADFLVTGAYDHCVRVWNSDNCLAVGTGHVEVVKSVCVIPGTVQVTPGSAPSKKKRGRPAGGAALDGVEQPIASFDFASTSKDGTVRLWSFVADPTNGQGKLTAVSVPAGLHSDSVDTCDVNASGSLIATGGWDSTVVVAQVADLRSATPTEAAKPLYSFSDHARPVLSVRFSPTRGSPTLYSTGLDGAVKMWDVTSGKMMSTLKGDHSAYGMSVRPPSDAASTVDLVACGHSDQRIRIYDPRSKTVATTMTGHRQWVYSVAWLWRPEEEGEQQSSLTLLASASEDGSVRIWDLRSTSAALLTLDALHNDGVLDVTYAGGMKIASGGKDNKTRNATVEQPH